MSSIGQMFRVFGGEGWSDLFFIALAIVCVVLGVWTMRRGRYLGG